MKEDYNLQKEGNLYTAEVPSGSGAIFGFRKWSWGEKNALSAECTTMNPLSGFITFDSTRYNEMLVVKTVNKKVNELFTPLTIGEVQSLDGQLGERLFRITQAINLVQEVDARNL